MPCKMSGLDNLLVHAVRFCPSASYGLHRLLQGKSAEDSRQDLLKLCQSLLDSENPDRYHLIAELIKLSDPRCNTSPLTCTPPTPSLDGLLQLHVVNASKRETSVQAGFRLILDAVSTYVRAVEILGEEAFNDSQDLPSFARTTLFGGETLTVDGAVACLCFLSKRSMKIDVVSRVLARCSNLPPASCQLMDNILIEPGFDERDRTEIILSLLS